MCVCVCVSSTDTVQKLHAKNKDTCKHTLAKALQTNTYMLCMVNTDCSVCTHITEYLQVRALEQMSVETESLSH